MYKLIENGVLRLEDTAVIPVNESNLDYQEYLTWIAAGNTSLPADIPDPKIAIQNQIDLLERQYMLPRGTREALLSYAIAIAATMGVTEPELYAVNIAYHKTKDFDTQIAALRAQL